MMDLSELVGLRSFGWTLGYWALVIRRTFRELASNPYTYVAIFLMVATYLAYKYKCCSRKKIK